MTALIFQHPIECAIAVCLIGYAIAAAALGWPFRGNR